jgi:hypothetical protein
MKATLPWLAALVLTAAGSALAQAQAYYPFPMPPQAPDPFGSCFYGTTCGGAVYGPSYGMNLPCAPFNGFRPPLQGPALQGQDGGCPAALAVHPFARSPRDYFMWNDP